MGENGTEQNSENSSIIKTPKLEIRTQSGNQLNYVKSIRANDLSFGIGPAVALGLFIVGRIFN